MKKFLTFSIVAVLFLVVAAVCNTYFADDIAAVIGSIPAMAVMVGGRRGGFGKVTPQAKLANVAAKLGNPGLATNQGSTLDIYHYVRFQTGAVNQTFTFFQDAQLAPFPFTNLSDNKLEVGEGLVIQYFAFAYMEIENTSGEVTAWSAAQQQSAIGGLNVSQFSFYNDNDRVIKKISLARANSVFNTIGGTSNNFVYELDTLLTLQTLINFYAELKVPPITVSPTEGNTAYLGLHLFGPGAILNTKRNF